MIRITALMALCIFLGLGCDRITGPFVEIQQDIDTTWNPVFVPRSNPIKKILLEDFTGHQCGNCPRAHEEAQNLSNQYPEKLIVLSEHVGYFAEVRSSGKYTYDFRTTVGNEIDNEFGASAAGLPKGMINRISHNNSKIHDKNLWNTLVSQELQKPVLADIQILYKWNSEKTKLDVAVQAKNIQLNTSENYKLFVYLVEDSIINWQKDYSKNPSDIPDYVHRHVLRASFNGTWGENVVWSNQLFEKKYALNIPDGYQKDKLSVLAAIYETNSKEIIQVEEKKIQ
jgi:hypothetical protein